MKKIVPMLAGVAFLLAFTTKPAVEAITVEGTLIDTKCYGMAPKMNKGNTHKVPGKEGKMVDMPNCATACAAMGIPAGIATEDGETYVVIAPAGGFSEHMAKEVKMEGEKVYDGAILPMKLWIKDDYGKWKEADLPGGMM